jgi:hypothetical protein
MLMMKTQKWSVEISPENREINRKKYADRLRKASWIYGILSLVIIPIYTILFATKADLLKQNMSYIGGYMDGYRGLMVWGVASGLFYLAFTSYLFKLTRFANRRIRRMLFAACSMLVITVLLPFVPETWPRAATLHNLFAMLAPVIMIITMYVFVFYLGKCDHRIYRKALTFLNAMVLISALLMFALGASGLLEVLFSVSMCVLLFSILPPAVIFLFCQKYILEGITMSGVKG